MFLYINNVSSSNVKYSTSTRNNPQSNDEPGVHQRRGSCGESAAR